MNVTASAMAAKLGNDESAPQIFKMNVDCFENVFEWLSLKDLLLFRRTCKRMKAVVDYYIKLNYPRLLHFCIKNRQTLMELSHSRLNCYGWIRHLYIFAAILDNTHNKIDGIKYILSEIETLKLCMVQIEGDFYEMILKYCPRLKYLGIKTETAPNTIIGTGNEWLLRHYPSLMHFELEIQSSTEQSFYCTELLEFFMQNPNIRIFSTNSAFLLTNRQWMLGSKIKLDRLDIYINHSLNVICNLANDLHKKEFYRRIQLYSCHSEELYQNQAQHIWTICNVEKLHLYSLPDHLPIPVVESIKKLSIYMCSLIPLDLQKLMATNLINLRQIEIQHARLNDIRPFICYAPKLKEIKLWKLLTDNADEPKFEDFLALNRDRQYSNNSKVTIYIDEKSFMKMKWTSKTKLSSIELKQHASCSLDHLFDWIF